MQVGRSVRHTVRGPVRDRLRWQQSRTPLLRGRRVDGPPDFVGIGVQRCGTSWWHGLIESHPGVASLGYGAKELHFFDQWWSGGFAAEQIERYHSNFLRGPGQLAGEWTPRYLHDPWAVPLLLQAAPQARLLVLLRDPVSRLRSGLTHARARGLPTDADGAGTAFHRGCYAAQLEPLLDMIPRTQLLVLQFERCVRETRRMLGATFDFLGLPHSAVPMTPARNALHAPVQLAPELLRPVRERYRADTARLIELFGADIDAALWPETMSTDSP